MIIGHYAMAFVAARAEPKLPLWQPMIGVVWLDILHSSLVLAGAEKAAVERGATAVVPIALIHYPFSHSLLAAVLWSAATWLLYRNRAGAWMAACVFSHFVLDLVAHRPDLPLISGEPKLGFGLWNHVAGTFLVENALLFGACALYLMRSRLGAARHAAILALCILGSALFFTFPAGHFPDDIRQVEAFALFVYALVPLVAFFAGRRAAVTPA